MVLYFSATGNSEYVAKAIAERLVDEAVSLKGYIREYVADGKGKSFESEDPYVFVFPVYLSTIPIVLRDFIKASVFSGNGRVYFVATCASAAGSVPNSAYDICKEVPFFTYMGYQSIIMPQNYVIYFKPSDDKKKRLCYENAVIQADSICMKIKSGEKLSEKKCSRIEYTATKLVEKWYSHSFTKTERFRVSDECMGCGLCVGNCPVNAIEMKEKKPFWIKKTCIHCMACISRCPRHVISYGNLSSEKVFHVCPSYESMRKKP